MPLTRRHIGATLDQSNFAATRMKKFFRDYIGGQPICYPTGTTGGYGAPVGTTGATNGFKTQVASYEYHVKGTGETLLSPTWDAANGLLFGLDLADNEGVEITAGIGALDLGSFVVGTDRGFYAKASIKIADVSGTDEFLFGFRKNQAYQTAHTAYTDYAAIGAVTSANPAAIQVKTRLNSGTAVTVNTTKTWADTETHSVAVHVKDDGKVRFLLDDAEPPVTKTDFIFDAGDTVNWFLFWLYSTTTPGTVHAQLFEWGYIPRRGE